MKNRILFVLTMLAMFVCLSVVGVMADDVTESIAKAKTLYDQGKNAEAIEWPMNSNTIKVSIMAKRIKDANSLTRDIKRKRVFAL